MKEVLTYLKPQMSGFLATVVDGMPDVRPFQFQFEEKGRLVFCTHSTKTVYHQLKNNPNVAFSLTTEEGMMIRIYGEVKFSDDLALKQSVLDRQEKLKGIFKKSTNPIYQVFYLEHGNATMINKKLGYPLREINF